MRCSRCKQVPRDSNRSSTTGVSPRTLPGWERLEFVLCSRCGALLPGFAAERTVLDKLEGLARFGLAAGTTAIMEP